MWILCCSTADGVLLLTDAITAGLDFEQALQDPEMVKLQASQQVRTVTAIMPAAFMPVHVADGTHMSYNCLVAYAVLSTTLRV